MPILLKKCYAPTVISVTKKIGVGGGDWNLMYETVQLETERRLI
jgi:hypothetical protein